MTVSVFQNGTTFAETGAGEPSAVPSSPALLPFPDPEFVLALVLIPIVVLVLAVVFGVILPRSRRRAARNGPIPIAPFGRGEAIAIPPRPSRAPAPTPATQAAPSPKPDIAPPPRSPEPSVIPIDMRAIELDQLANEDRTRVRRMHVAGDRRDVVRDERSAVTLRLERPQDGTLQFLPGRLEVIEGGDPGQEIKFVRTPGPDGTTITFGRAEGAQYRHVQLHVPTVSRMHAKLFLDGKSWSLINLSATNPVVVNGLALAGEGSSVILREGDRIEMGEIVFRFRAK